MVDVVEELLGVGNSPSSSVTLDQLDGTKGARGGFDAVFRSKP